MKSGWLILVAMAAAAQALAPARAQDAAESESASNQIGPPQLRDFSLNGTVTRQREEEAPVATPPREAPQRAPATAAPQREVPPVPPESPAASAPDPRVQSEPGPISPTPAGPLPEIAFPPVEAPPAAEPATGTEAPAAAPGTLLPWLLAAALVAAGAAFLYLRQKRRSVLPAGGAAVSQFDPDLAPRPQPERPAKPEPQARAAGPQPQPQPQPQPVPPQPLPAAASGGGVVSTGGGVVSTRLRPWLVIEFTPERALVDEQKAAVEFSISLFNSGSAPARDVLLEGALFNAGPLQDQEIGNFFANPVGEGGRIAAIPPLQRIGVRNAVLLPRNQVLPIEVEGRPLFVPLVAFNALYGWGASGAGQTSATYVVGKQTDGEKLAPFRLDLGPRVFRGLSAREHELHVRR